MFTASASIVFRALSLGSSTFLDSLGFVEAPHTCQFAQTLEPTAVEASRHCIQTEIYIDTDRHMDIYTDIDMHKEEYYKFALSA